MLKLLLLCILSLAIVLVCPFMGIVPFHPVEVLSNEEAKFIFWSLRVPRTLAAFLAGGGLAVAGMIYQALFRNPLASPYTLGVSGGASLGAAICIALGLGGSLAGLSFVSIGAFAGALGAVLLVYGFAWSKERNSATLLLAGVVVATVCSGLIMFIYYVSPLRHSFQIMQWIMGGLDGFNYRLLLTMAAPLILFFGVVGLLLPQLDLFLTGEELAHSRGVNTVAGRNLFIVITALAVGSIVAFCGPIGFVGIISPHICRLLMPGIRHRVLAACSLLVGGAFLTISDMLARSIAPPAEIPVGIITALCGGPFFLFILFKRKSRLLL
ncbi:MAG: iron chelate uptake ABC transporter family permease subunit [Chitinivibrionales bacterium]|nr:iron chelate uptake ABC transporter family permease subunit [Chitinivibrionales bacterium]